MKKQINVWDYAGHIMERLPEGILMTTKAEGKVDSMVIGWGTRSGFVGQLLILVATIWIVMQAQIMLAGDGGLPVYAAF